MSNHSGIISCTGANLEPGNTPFRYSLLLLFVLFCLALSAQDKIPVFVSGTEGYKTFRIPALIHSPAGELLAFSEGRVHGDNDFGDIDIVMKRSVDAGRTWSPLRVVAENDTLQAGNPAPVVDYTDPAYPGGRIFLFYNTSGNSERDIRNGKGCREVWYKTSADDGMTWSAPVNITTQVSRPDQPDLNPDYHFKEGWRWYANTPGHAIQLKNGQYKGRIFVAANHSSIVGDPAHEEGFSHGFYSDDHGKSFLLGQSLPIAGSNEAMAAELPSGLMLNARNQKKVVRARVVATSKDGGAQWDTAYYDLQLPDPACQGSILEMKGKKGKELLVSCNAATRSRRDSLTLRISYDLGLTWPVAFCIDSDSTQRDNTAYSDITELDKGRIGVLYERDRYAQIVFTAIRGKKLKRAPVSQ